MSLPFEAGFFMPGRQADLEFCKMATTDFGSHSPAQKKVWATEVVAQGRDQSFWMSNGFMGRNTGDMSRPIHRITDLTKTESGDRVIIQLVADLEGDGVVGDNQLTGNEESLVNDSQEIRVDQLRHGVKRTGRMSEQRTVIKFRSMARDKLAFWLGDSIDEQLFLCASGRAFTLKTDGSTRAGSQWPGLAYAADITPASANRIIYASTATSEATLTTAMTMTWDIIVRANAFAKRKRIKGIREGGKSYYIIVMSTEQLRDLKQSADFKTLHKDAAPRGSKNPLFTGASIVIDNIVIHEHQKVFNTLGIATSSKWGSGGTVDGAQALLFGAQALAYTTVSGNGDSAFWEEGDINDYGNQPGIGYGRIMGMLKPKFQSAYDNNAKEDFGIVSIKTAAAAT